MIILSAVVVELTLHCDSLVESDSQQGVGESWGRVCQNRFG